MNIRTHLGHIIQHAQAAEREWDAMPRAHYTVIVGQFTLDRLNAREAVTVSQEDGGSVTLMHASDFPHMDAAPPVTAERVGAVLTDGNPLHLAYSEQWRIPEVAEKIASLFNREEMIAARDFSEKTFAIP